jgi:hypothetical protein
MMAARVVGSNWAGICGADRAGRGLICGGLAGASGSCVRVVVGSRVRATERWTGFWSPLGRESLCPVVIAVGHVVNSICCAAGERVIAGGD